MAIGNVENRRKYSTFVKQCVAFNFFFPFHFALRQSSITTFTGMQLALPAGPQQQVTSIEGLGFCSMFLFTTFNPKVLNLLEMKKFQI